MVPGAVSESSRRGSATRREGAICTERASFSSYHVVSLHVNRVATGVNLIWQAGSTNVVLKHAPGPHTFCIDAKLNWSTGTACVTVDGVEFQGRSVGSSRIPFNQLTLNADHSGTSWFGPIDVWYFQAPPPEPALMPLAPQSPLGKPVQQDAHC